MLVHPRVVLLVLLHAVLAQREVAVDADPLAEGFAPVAWTYELRSEIEVRLLLVAGVGSRRHDTPMPD